MKMSKDYQARLRETAKKHLELIRERLLDGFASDETMNYDPPAQSKNKFKNLHT